MIYLDELERTLHSLSNTFKMLTDKGDITIIVDDAQFNALRTHVYTRYNTRSRVVEQPDGHYLISLWTAGGQVKIKRRGVNV